MYRVLSWVSNVGCSYTVFVFSYSCCYSCQRDFEQGFLTSGTEPGVVKDTVDQPSSALFTSPPDLSHDWLMSLCVCLMLLNCALQEGGFITNQAPPQPIRGKSYTVGRSYDTSSGRVVTMMTSDDSPDVTMTTMSIDTGRQVRIIPLSTVDDVITGGPLITIREVKTPTSPSELPPGVCGTISDVISGDDTRGGGGRSLDLRGVEAYMSSPLTPVLPPKSPLDKLNLSPTPSPGHLSSRTSPSTARVVRWLAGWWSAWKWAWGANTAIWQWHVNPCYAETGSVAEQWLVWAGSNWTLWLRKNDEADKPNVDQV